jgi:hypothetical protein
VNRCLKKMGILVQPVAHGGEVDHSAVCSVINRRLRLFPTIKNLILTAMVDERSLMLKKVKNELRGEPISSLYEFF